MKNIGLIAGNGKFPLIFAEHASRAGYNVVAVAHHGETDPAIERFVQDIQWVYVGQLGKIIRNFQRAEVSEAVMAGGIRKVKLFDNFRPDLRGTRFLAKLKSREDDDLLRGIANELAADGINIIESTFCLSEIIPTQGVLTKRSPTQQEWDDIHLGFRKASKSVQFQRSSFQRLSFHNFSFFFTAHQDRRSGIWLWLNRPRAVYG